MLNGRIQEVELLTNTKASQAEVEVIKNNKVGVEELKAVEDQIQEIKSQMSNFEGEEKEEEPDSDGLSPISNSAKYKRYIKNVHGYGEEIYKLIHEDQKSGSSIGIKKHLRYHQLQLNEICDKILYDDNRFENMRNEILLQRDQLSQFREENQFLKEKIDRGVEIMKQVDDTLKTIQKFKTQIENDRESIFTAVIKTQDE